MKLAKNTGCGEPLPRRICSRRNRPDLVQHKGCQAAVGQASEEARSRLQSIITDGLRSHSAAKHQVMLPAHSCASPLVNLALAWFAAGLGCGVFGVPSGRGRSRCPMCHLVILVFRPGQGLAMFIGEAGFVVVRPMTAIAKGDDQPTTGTCPVFAVFDRDILSFLALVGTPDEAVSIVGGEERDRPPNASLLDKRCWNLLLKQLVGSIGHRRQDGRRSRPMLRKQYFE